jgi:Ca2+-dependent lipid-binding protein
MPGKTARHENTGDDVQLPQDVLRNIQREKRGTVNELMRVYLLVVAIVSCSWLLGSLSFSFLWVFILSAALFVVWKSKVTSIVRRHVAYQEEIIHRKRALNQSETAEWFNFLMNRW